MDAIIKQVQNVLEGQIVGPSQHLLMPNSNETSGL